MKVELEEAVKVFISGKITGEPIEECCFKFREACEYLYGERVNPLRLKGIYFGISHEEAMEICLKELKTCSHIYMLKDWKESKGAKIERQFALGNGIKIIYQ